DVTVTASDPYGNTATSYLGTVHFSSSDSKATLPSDYTFTGTDAGKHTFTLGATLKTAGRQTITATDTITATITGSVPIQLMAAAASSLSVTGPSAVPA